MELPKEVVLAVSVSAPDETLVHQVSTAVGALQAFSVPRTFQNFQYEPVQDETVAPGTARNGRYKKKKTHKSQY